MIDLNKYKEFVDSVTSADSKSTKRMTDRFSRIDFEKDVNMARLLTGSIGLSGEIGEFNEHVKKLCFHDKEFDKDLEAKMKSELADIFWYWNQVCLAMSWDPNEVIEVNVKKLQARHPDGEFNANY